MYLDSSKVPKSANITCDCDVGIKENVNISATSISHPDLVGISNDGLTFIQFSDGQHTWVGQKRVYVRYITYETIVNEVCLKFEGNDVYFNFINYLNINNRHFSNCHSYSFITVHGILLSNGIWLYLSGDKLI